MLEITELHEDTYHFDYTTRSKHLHTNYNKSTKQISNKLHAYGILVAHGYGGVLLSEELDAIIKEGRFNV